jgi:hypothetical protein
MWLLEQVTELNEYLNQIKGYHIRSTPYLPGRKSNIIKHWK